MSSNPEQELCPTTVDNPELMEVCCHEKEDETQKQSQLSPEATIEATPDQAADTDPKEQAPKSDSPETTDIGTIEKATESGPPEPTIADSIVTSEPSPCVPACKCKVQAPPQPLKYRTPKAVFQYYLQFGFTPQAVTAIWHLPPKELANKKVSFVPTTPPKNC
ncbi:MAG: hypothetical protein GX489_03165 [Firmicutes bacterium]|nr:hypothetical protein [Bacillota bacterium]